MAQQENTNLEQYNTLYSLKINAGIKRDGTIFESEDFTDGVWCRFQRERAKKMGGYKYIFNSLVGIYRGMILQPYNGINYIFAGNYNELDVFTTNITYASGIGPFAVTMLPGTVELFPISGQSTSGSFKLSGNQTGSIGSGTPIIFSQSGTPTTYITNSSVYTSGVSGVVGTTTIGFSGTIPTNPSVAWINNTPIFTPDPPAGPYRITWQFDSIFSNQGGQLQLLAHPGYNLVNIDNAVKSQVLIGSITPTGTGTTWNFTGLSDSTGQNPTYQPISVDGGVCVLYPFIFVYGSNGFIANNNVQTNTTPSQYLQQSLYDWNGSLANQTNISSSKIIKGMTVRGGTNAPSGLFWSTDSLIRVSFTAANAPTYWNYDIVSSQISIMSSNAVVEMDGTFFWMGVDRFYLYNGQVQVLPNDKNVNWLFNNVNFQQRQKVWATKVPRYNEIWFFYPRGTATECTDAIIYNTKDKIWYDAGSAVGAQRSCGYTTELFPTPLWADWNYVPMYGQAQIIAAKPSSQPPLNGNQFYLTGNQTPRFAPGGAVTFSKIVGSKVYNITNAQFIYNSSTIPLPGVTLVTVSTNFTTTPPVGSDVFFVEGGYTIWQHETGVDAIGLGDTTAVYSSITTSDISWIGGTPSGDNLQGVNRRMHLRRFEPNFLQSGTMSMTILGRKFAGGINAQIAGPYFFNQDTGKIDLRVEFRLMRLKFESNEVGGNYEMGRNIITAEYGDERP
jgi:hypothetical protein